MSESDLDTERTTVTTYIPAYQARQWSEHADDLEMSRSEFVRTMVQAGRRGFEPADSASTAPSSTESDGTDFETRIERVLADAGPLSWDQLLAALTEDIEDRLEEALLDLQAENRISYSGQAGGYTLVGGHE